MDSNSQPLVLVGTDFTSVQSERTVIYFVSGSKEPKRSVSGSKGSPAKGVNYNSIHLKLFQYKKIVRNYINIVSIWPQWIYLFISYFILFHLKQNIFSYQGPLHRIIWNLVLQPKSIWCPWHENVWKPLLMPTPSHRFRFLSNQTVTGNKSHLASPKGKGLENKSAQR